MSEEKLDYTKHRIQDIFVECGDLEYFITALRRHEPIEEVKPEKNDGIQKGILGSMLGIRIVVDETLDKNTAYLRGEPTEENPSGVIKIINLDL